MPRYIPTGQPALFAEADRRSELPELPIERLHRIVDWEVFRPTLEQAVLPADPRAPGGRPRFDPVLMFKVLILQRAYGLSDAALELQILDRITFQRFLGLTQSDRVPDQNTIWDFREALTAAEIGETLFRTFDGELARHGIRQSDGAIIDATFIDVPRRRTSRDESADLKEDIIPESLRDDPRRLAQTDCDATWAIKNKETHFGYKLHIVADVTKFILAYSFTQARDHDSLEAPDLYEHAAGTIYGDSAYHSAELAKRCADLGLADDTNERAYRNTPLTDEQVEENRRRSRTRSRVEHIFGTMTQMGMDCHRAIGFLRNELISGLDCLLINMQRCEFLTRTA